MNIDDRILSHLVLNPDYGRKVLPFLKEDYFASREDRILFNLTANYIQTYNNFPSKEALFIDLSNLTDINEDTFKVVQGKIGSIAIEETTDEKWLLDKTEEFCKQQSLKNALFQSIGIWKGEDKNLDKGSIPKLLQDALSVSFDTHVGHDFLEEWEERYDFIRSKQKRIPFGLDCFNKITKGGFAESTLNMLVAGTHVGKTLCMCSMAADNLAMGYNVLYITLEMGEMGDPSISQRIEANLLDTPINDLIMLPRETVKSRIEKLKVKGAGKLIIKEYPVATVGASHFRFLLNELLLKKNFKPDIIYIDYLNLCVSSRYRNNAKAGMYEHIKAVAEEVRGLAQENKLPVVSASQLNRAGFVDSDAGMEHIAESWGLSHTADFLGILFSSEELQRLNQYVFKQTKNRYDNMAKMPKFVIGVDRDKMRLYDVDAGAQTLIPAADTPVMDNTDFGDSKPKFNMDTFKDWK